MLLKFFTNSSATAYLRQLAGEFDESTNAIRHELNNLSKAGYLVSQEDGRTIKYRANTGHPLYNEVKNLVHKYLGIDKIIDHILSRIGDLDAAYIVGDYAKGKDSGTIELILVGRVNRVYLDNLIIKATGLLNRRIKAEIISKEQYLIAEAQLENALLIWKNL